MLMEMTGATRRYFCIFVLTLNLLLDNSVDTSRIDCARFVFARKCRGISAKRFDVSSDARKVKPAAEKEEDAAAAATTAVDAATEEGQFLIPRLRYFARALNQSMRQSSTAKRHKLSRESEERMVTPPEASGSSLYAAFTLEMNEKRPVSSKLNRLCVGLLQFRALQGRGFNLSQKRCSGHDPDHSLP